ncbi:MAG: hypothetical protein IIZ28_05955 [Erysipelotrichaceae bacterium]|nr:hypothetical protein [Erysipelotrichaceae bacterium]
MKKIITLLFVSLLTLCMPANLFAEEDVTEVSGEQASVTLYANIGSQYFVKLPRRVDVKNVNTSFDVFAKGSIAANKKLDVTAGTGEHILRDNTAGSSRSYPLNVSATGTSFAADLLAEEYQNDLKAVFTVTHAALSAGDYSYDLPIVIALNEANS